ncbi:MAG TPA: tRNA epoxyqueuosine(34) reductase QueG, partial [Gemmatimonadales bacterium]|nr:tRNA epoxyqueuosine(34) reductase QueG [Gemmatimonadales bacterium]
MTSATLERRLKAEAYAAGFDLAGIATLGPAESARVYEAWVAEGLHGEMGYMARNADVRADTTRPHPGARSALVVAMDYGGREPAGPVARYARGDDYHDVMRERLGRVHAWLATELGRPVLGRAYVDTAPILERELAQRAGLGWVGKNTNLINPRIGSFFFIAALFTELELAPDAPFEADRCGTCRRCLDACPTDAFVEARVLDARRCISYLTI